MRKSVHLVGYFHVYIYIYIYIYKTMHGSENVKFPSLVGEHAIRMKGLYVDTT